MNTEIQQIIEQLKDAYEGDPWFGKSATRLLAEVSEETAFVQPGGQHNILQLVWHMNNWKAFAINRLQKDTSTGIHYFEEMDWQQLDHSDKKLWQKGLENFHQLHKNLVEVLEKMNDDVLQLNVYERNYPYKKLLYGILQHDIYHLGQIAYILKLQSKQP